MSQFNCEKKTTPSYLQNSRHISLPNCFFNLLKIWNNSVYLPSQNRENIQIETLNSFFSQSLHLPPKSACTSASPSLLRSARNHAVTTEITAASSPLSLPESRWLQRRPSPFDPEKLSSVSRCSSVIQSRCCSDPLDVTLPSPTLLCSWLALPVATSAPAASVIIAAVRHEQPRLLLLSAPPLSLRSEPRRRPRCGSLRSLLLNTAPPPPPSLFSPLYSSTLG